jgi:cysteinyl-tRNA synthetase
LTQSEKAYERIKNSRENLLYIAARPKEHDVDISGAVRALDEGFNAGMDDDLNTAGAIGVIFDYVKAVNTLFADGGPAGKAKAALDALDARLDVLGLLPRDDDGGIPDDVARMAAERDMARKNRDWAESDRLRDLIQGLGYEIKDTKDGAKISKL